MKGETISANFWQGKCKFIANFSAIMVTSLPSHYFRLTTSVSLLPSHYFRLTLSLSPIVPHAQYRKRFRASYNEDLSEPSDCMWKPFSRMSRVGCYGITNADWLISRPAAQILPGLLRERVRMAKIKETERVRIQSLPAFFCKSRDS